MVPKVPSRYKTGSLHSLASCGFAGFGHRPDGHTVSVRWPQARLGGPGGSCRGAAMLVPATWEACARKASRGPGREGRGHSEGLGYAQGILLPPQVGVGLASLPWPRCSPGSGRSPSERQWPQPRAAPKQSWVGESVCIWRWKMGRAVGHYPWVQVHSSDGDLPAIRGGSHWISRLDHSAELPGIQEMASTLSLLDKAQRESDASGRADISHGVLIPWVGYSPSPSCAEGASGFGP